MKIVAIIQARTGSTRLPNKIFAEVSGKPFVWHVVNRLKDSKTIEDVVLATTDHPRDDILELWGNDNGVKVFRGSEDDVLSRYFFAALQNKADVIVRITADDFCKDTSVIDLVVQGLLDENLDFACNNNPPSYPEGLDVEVFTFSSLEKAHQDSKDPFEREHVTQHFYRNPEKFKQKNYSYKENISSIRLTMDEQADLDFARYIYEKLFDENKNFLLEDVLELLRQDPKATDINKKIKRSTMYSDS